MQTDECIMKGAHLTIDEWDVQFCRVNKVNILDAPEDDYLYIDSRYDGRRDGSQRLLVVSVLLALL